jgi:glycosyltransferase involved in cell wall biosynthesis
MAPQVITARLAVQQRLLPAYRTPLFEALAAIAPAGLSVFAGQARPEEALVAADQLKTARLAWGRNLYTLPVSSPLCLVWQTGLMKWLQAWNPDVLIAEANPRLLSTVLAVRWMHRRGRPVLGWGLGAPPVAGQLGIWLAQSWRGFLQSFDGLLAYSRRGAEQYRAAGIAPEKVFVAPNAVAPRPSTTPPVRSPVFVDRPTVIFVGRLQARKRIDHLLAACAALPEALQPRLLIVGDGPARPALTAQAAEMYPMAEFLGTRRGAELASSFAQADLFVLPGTGGLAVQEAMAAGLPVIVAQGDGTQDDLVRPENGWQVPPFDLAALQGALAEALSDAPRLRRMGAESYRIISEEVNLETLVAVFVQAIQSLVTGFDDSEP